MGIRTVRINPKNEVNKELLIQMHRTCFNLPLPYTDGQWWIAYDGMNPVGFCAVIPSFQWQKTGYLLRSGVMPDYRGRGLQKRFIKLRIKYAKEQGWDWLVTDTRYNPASVNSLISCGFKLYKPSTPWSFKDALYWRRKVV